MENLQVYAIEGIVLFEENDFIVEDSKGDQELYIEDVKDLIYDLEGCLVGDLDIFLIPRRGNGAIREEIVVAIGRLLFSTEDSLLRREHYLKGQGEPFNDLYKMLSETYNLFDVPEGEWTEMCLIKGHLTESGVDDLDFSIFRYD